MEGKILKEKLEMKKSNMIEIMVYIVIIIVGTVILFVYKPKEIEFEIPKNFEVVKERSIGVLIVMILYLTSKEHMNILDFLNDEADVFIKKYRVLI